MELFGVTAMNPAWTFDDSSVDFEQIIMIGVAHDYDEIKKAPEAAAGAEVIRQYGRAAKAAKDIASWIRRRWWVNFQCLFTLVAELLDNGNLDQQWTAFLRKSALTGPDSFCQVLTPINDFLSPVFSSIKSGNTFDQEWTAPGPWRNA